MTHRRSALLPALAGSILLFATGCATTTEISGFESFARAGDQYAQAVDALLVRSSEVLVDTNSDKLLETAAQLPGTMTAAEVKEQDDAVGLNLAEIRRLRAQVALLSDYFDTLARLASSDAPSVIGASAASTVSELDALTQTLHGGPLIEDADAVGPLVSSLGTLVVRGVQGRELRQELDARKQTIAHILELHKKLFAVLAAQVGADEDFVRQRQYEKKVVEPLLAGSIADPATWKKERYAFLQPPPVAQQLSAARSAASQLQSAWAELLAGSITPADVQAVVAELEPILSAAERLEASRKNGSAPSTEPSTEVSDGG